MDGPLNPTLESILFVLFIILACAVPLILAWAILRGSKKSKEKSATKK